MLVTVLPYVAGIVPPLRSWALRRLLPRFHGTATAGSALLGWVSPVQFNGVAIYSPDGTLVATMNRLQGDRPLWKYLFHGVRSKNSDEPENETASQVVTFATTEIRPRGRSQTAVGGLEQRTVRSVSAPRDRYTWLSPMASPREDRRFPPYKLRIDSPCRLFPLIRLRNRRLPHFPRCCPISSRSSDQSGRKLRRRRRRGKPEPQPGDPGRPESQPGNLGHPRAAFTETRGRR